ncbi:hypothetical protein D3C85_1628950 [compost metagenome]
MAHQVRDGLVIQLRRDPVKAQGRLLQEIFEQLQDVFAAFAQRRQFQGHHVEAVIQVAAEFAGLARFDEVGFGRRDHPAIHRHALVRAEAFEGALL